MALHGRRILILQVALDWACGLGQDDCSAIQADQSCYAFDSHYHKMSMATVFCDFNGVATITTADPMLVQMGLLLMVLPLAMCHFL